MTSASSNTNSHFMTGKVRLRLRAKLEIRLERGRRRTHNKFPLLPANEGPSQEESCAKNQVPGQ